MIDELELLMQLQEIDLRIKEQELAQEQYPAALAELNAEISKAKSAVVSITAKRDRASADKNGAQDQISKATEGLARSQERLNSIKTNREYDAVHAEIESQKSVSVNAEGRLKTLGDEVARLDSAIADIQAEYDRIKSENEPKIADLQSKIDAIDSTIASISKERDQLVPQIGKTVLRTYEQIRKKRKTGRALSYVSESRTCTVCYKVLEPQLYNEIHRGVRMILCQSCGSIFVWKSKNK